MASAQEKLLGQLLKESQGQSTMQSKNVGTQLRQLSALEEINFQLESMNNAKSKKGDSKVAQVIGGAFAGMGSGLKDMLESLVLLPKIKDKHITGFTNFLDTLLKSFERSKNINSESLDGVLDIMKNADVLANNVLRFSLKMKLAEKTLPMAQKGMDKLAKMFIKFETDLSSSKLNFKKSERVIGTLQFLAMGISQFSKAMALSTPLAIIGYPGYLLTSAMILGYSRVFAAMNVKKFKRGSRALQSLAIGLIGITGGLLFFQVAGITLETIGKTLLVVGGLSAIMVMISLVGKRILLGAVSLIALGGAMMLLSMGLTAFKELELGMGDVGILLATMGGLALVAGLAGTFAIPILMGAAAFGLIGVALSTISEGLNSFAKLEWNDSITENLKNAIGGLSEAFGSLGLIETATLSMKIALLGTASGTLQSLAVGLAAFKRAEFNDGDADKMQYVIGSVAAAFAVAGSSEGNTTSVLSFLSGVDLSPNNVERGINSVMGAGAALTSIVEGLVAWKGIYSSGFTPEDFTMGSDGLPIQGSLLHNIYSVLTVIKAVFGQIGQSANTGTSLIKNIFGADFAESDVEQGIESVSGAGEIIIGIADGLKAFKSLETMGFTSEDFALGEDGLPMKGSLLHNIYSVLTVVKAIFGEIGKSSRGESSWMKSIFGSDFSESDVKIGIDSVAGAADIVVGIADGLKVLATIEDIDTVTEKMIGLITAYPLAAIQAYRVVQDSGIGFTELSNFLENPYMQIVEMFDRIADTMLKSEKATGAGFLNLGKGIDAIFTQVERVSTVKGRMYSVMLFEKFVNNVEKLAKHKRDIKDLGAEFASLGDGMGQVLDPMTNTYMSSDPTTLTPSTPPLFGTSTPINEGLTTPNSLANTGTGTTETDTGKGGDKQMMEMMKQMIMMLQQQMSALNKSVQSVKKSNDNIVSKLNSGIKIKDGF